MFLRVVFFWIWMSILFGLGAQEAEWQRLFQGQQRRYEGLLRKLNSPAFCDGVLYISPGMCASFLEKVLQPHLHSSFPGAFLRVEGVRFMEGSRLEFRLRIVRKNSAKTSFIRFLLRAKILPPREGRREVFRLNFYRVDILSGGRRGQRGFRDLFWRRTLSSGDVFSQLRLRISPQKRVLFPLDIVWGGVVANYVRFYVFSTYLPMEYPRLRDPSGGEEPWQILAENEWLLGALEQVYRAQGEVRREFLRRREEIVLELRSVALEAAMGRVIPCVLPLRGRYLRGELALTSLGEWIWKGRNRIGFRLVGSVRLQRLAEKYFPASIFEKVRQKKVEFSLKTAFRFQAKGGEIFFSHRTELERIVLPRRSLGSEVLAEAVRLSLDRLFNQYFSTFRLRAPKFYLFLFPQRHRLRLRLRSVEMVEGRVFVSFQGSF
ncbi:MAG: hypothetical protein D6805_01365 [Planctomycetota bacterium]|nr:MAG: hypothetical protein D6805_01365 [Planctomycetota bacterium]